MGRSLRVRKDCIDYAKKSLLCQGYVTQAMLAEAVGISQGTVSGFLNGKPVDLRCFFDICHFLNLDWQSIADLDRSTLPPTTAILLMSYDEPCEGFVQDLSQMLGKDYQIQQALHTDKVVQQGQTLQAAITNCDYFMVCLSPASASSDVVVELLKQAAQLSTSRAAPKPIIIPILNQIALSDLGYELNQYLGSMICWEWKNSDNTQQFAEALLNIIPKRQLPEALPNVAEPMSISPDGLYPPAPNASPDFPEGQVAIDSQFYIERPPIESRCYEEIQRLGTLIRIKAPRQMGKTSLMARIVKQAEQNGDLTAILDLQWVSEQTLKESDRFLKWFCVSISRALQISPALLQDYWGFSDSNTDCKAYLEDCILPKLTAPLTIALDEVDRIFAYPEVFRDFFGLLRALHEEAKRREIWSRLKLVIVHSTEVYVPMDVNQSPFNVGLAIELPEFTPQQIQSLAHRHQLEWSLTDSDRLMALIGGHPFLNRLALYHIARNDATLSKILQTATAPEGLFADHLYRCELILGQHPELSEAMRQVVTSDRPVFLPPPTRFKLKSMGLIKLTSEGASPRSALYYQYFTQILANAVPKINRDLLFARDWNGV